jgi:TolB-like protein/pimeloyl-ACP methyl ester carboxylesterase
LHCDALIILVVDLDAFLSAFDHWTEVHVGLLHFVEVFIAVVGAGGSIAVGVWRWQETRRSRRARRAKPGPTLAVLPFQNFSDKAQEPLADSLAEDLITELSKQPKLNLIARNSTFAFKGASHDIRTVGKALDADYVLEGSLRKAGEVVRVTAQLIRTSSGHHLWADRYDRQLKDPLAFQDEVTRLIVAGVAAALEDAPKALPTPAPPQSGFAAFLDPDLPVPERPTVKYADCHGQLIAYAVQGEGPLDIIVTPGAVTHLEGMWDFGITPPYIQLLKQFGRVIWFDKRGQGLSDPIIRALTPEERADDIGAVLDAVGSQQAVLYGVSEGGPFSILYAASHAERIKGLIIHGSFAIPPHTQAGASSVLPDLVARWGTGVTREIFSADFPEGLFSVDQCARMERLSATPNGLRAQFEMGAQIDVRSVLPTIRVPTLVLHCEQDHMVPLESGRYIAEHIPGARLVIAQGTNHIGLDPNGVFKRAITEFMDEIAGSSHMADEVLATVLAIKPGAGERASVAELLTRQARAHRGRVIESLDAEDMLLAAFDGPIRAVKCADAVRLASTRGAAPAQALHAGLVSTGSGRATGEAISHAAALAKRAAPGEVVLTKPLRDLLGGSDLKFTPARLKGEPEPLFHVGPA